MEQETEEINKLPTQEVIDRELVRLNNVRLRCDQDAREFKQATEKSDVDPDEVAMAFKHKQSDELLYMGICDWLWANTPHGFYFDHDQQKYVLRLKSSL